VPRAIILAAVFALIYTYHTGLLTGDTKQKSRKTSINDDPRCAAYPDPGTIAVAVRASASDITPESLSRTFTTLRCLSPSRLLLFSDLDYSVGPYQLHNVLSEVTPSLVQTHPDFEFYRQQHSYTAEGGNVRDLHKKPVLRANGPHQDEHSSQSLEKYKYLHMIERAWKLAPGMEWYAFFDESSFISWPNLVRWLRGIDASKMRYMGHKTHLSDLELDVGAEKGGIILSGALVESLANAQNSVARAWDRRAADMDSGSQVLATALQTELSINLTDSWPLTVGEEIGMVPFQQEMWCEPVIAIPALPVDTTAKLLANEQAMLAINKDFILSYGHVFKQMAMDHSMVIADYWYNAADIAEDPNYAVDWNDPRGRTDDHYFDPNDSFSACALACNNYRDCVQFQYLSYAAVRRRDGSTKYEGGICHLSKVFRFGKARDTKYWADRDDDDERGGTLDNTHMYTSGWNIARFLDARAKAVC